MSKIRWVSLKAKEEKLRELEQRCSLNSHPELLNNALALFKWAVEMREQGSVIVAINENKNKLHELSLEVLDRIPPK